MSDAPTAEMPFSFEDFLNEEFEVNGVKMPRHRYICWLIIANGGLEIGRWTDTPVMIDGHQRGLSLADAIELMRVLSFMNGLIVAGQKPHEILAPLVKAYAEEVTPPLQSDEVEGE